MKKNLFILSVLMSTALFSTSCTKEGTSDPLPIDSGYILILGSDISYVKYSKIIVFECAENGDKIANRQIDNPTTGQNYSYKVTSDKAVKVKVYCDYSISLLGVRDSRWIAQVFYLEKGKDITISLNGDTMMTNKEP